MMYVLSKSNDDDDDDEIRLSSKCAISRQYGREKFLALPEKVIKDVL